MRSPWIPGPRGLIHLKNLKESLLEVTIHRFADCDVEEIEIPPAVVRHLDDDSLDARKRRSGLRQRSFAVE